VHNVLQNLQVNRVDLVTEGANSAAFIEIYKRKECIDMDLNELLGKLKPEHSEVVKAAMEESAKQLKDAQDNVAKVQGDLDKANKDLEAARADVTKEKANASKAEEKATSLEKEKKAAEDKLAEMEGKKTGKAGASFDETESLVKSLPEDAQKLVEKLRTQAKTAEDELRKQKDDTEKQEAIAKAAKLKALPIEADKLADMLKNAPDGLYELLESINNAIDGVVLNEVGKNKGGAQGSDAWEKIEAAAAEVKKSNPELTQQKAIATVLKQKPELYEEYLKGGK